MRDTEKKGQYGSMEPLGREDFVREVTEGSRKVLSGDEVEKEDKDGEEEEAGLDEEGEEGGIGRRGRRRLRGTGVVVFLYKDSYVRT